MTITSRASYLCRKFVTSGSVYYLLLRSSFRDCSGDWGCDASSSQSPTKGLLHESRHASLHPVPSSKSCLNHLALWSSSSYVKDRKESSLDCITHPWEEERRETQVFLPFPYSSSLARIFVRKTPGYKSESLIWPAKFAIHYCRDLQHKFDQTRDKITWQLMTFILIFNLQERFALQLYGEFSWKYYNIISGE